MVWKLTRAQTDMTFQLIFNLCRPSSWTGRINGSSSVRNELDIKQNLCTWQYDSDFKINCEKLSIIFYCSKQFNFPFISSLSLWYEAYRLETAKVVSKFTRSGSVVSKLLEACWDLTLCNYIAGNMKQLKNRGQARRASGAFCVVKQIFGNVREYGVKQTLTSAA